MSHEPASDVDGTAEPTAPEIGTADRLAMLAGELDGIVDRLDDLDEADLEEASDEELAGLLDALKTAENVVEDTRKEQVEEELDERVDIGDSVGDFTRVQGHRKYVPDEDAAIAALQAAGIDPLSVMEIKANELADALEDSDLLNADAHIDRYEYTYYL